MPVIVKHEKGRHKMTETRNYLKGSSGGNGTKKLPDDTLHAPPGAMYALGGLGCFSGLLANIWQVITTFTAFWAMFNPAGTPVNLQKQPVVFIICGMMSFSFQMALLFLVFRLDTTWKKHRAGGSIQQKAQQAKSTAVELVQQVDLVLIWGGLGFIVDTIGDFTFISFYVANLDGATAAFCIFCYAASLYALSTVAFVRSIEYLWAGFAAADTLSH